MPLKILSCRINSVSRNADKTLKLRVISAMVSSAASLAMPMRLFTAPIEAKAASDTVIHLPFRYAKRLFARLIGSFLLGGLMESLIDLIDQIGDITDRTVDDA